MKFRKRYDEKPISRWNRKDFMDYFTNVYSMGKDLPTDDYLLATCFILAVKRADPSSFQEGLKEGGFIRELAQKVLDCALNKEEASSFFKKYGLDLYYLAGEPRPL